jgi:hypothetical protein
LNPGHWCGIEFINDQHLRPPHVGFSRMVAHFVASSMRISSTISGPSEMANRCLHPRE